MNKKGFTLIELLAVIIILGILMIIAIPSVTKYINDSRKSAYIDTAKGIINSTKNLVNEGKLEMFDTGTTYYIPINCISAENTIRSPYGEFVEDQAFVLVTYNGKGYNYYWVSRDETGQGIKDPVMGSNLKEEDIESDIAYDYIKTNVTKDGTNNVLVLDKETCKIFNEGGTIAARTILKTAKAANQLNQIQGTDIYIFKGGTANPPSNYVMFNGEKWRIIGIYNDQIKIQKASSVGRKTWHTSAENPGWIDSSLKEYLNSEYYDSLNDSAKEMLEEGIWNVGTVLTNETAIQAYTSSVTTQWSGKVGLMATYEFLYASAEIGCDNVDGSNGNFNITCGILENDWMNSNYTTWTICPSGTWVSMIINSNGYVKNSSVDNSYNVFPAVFLKSSVKIADGDGSLGNPYILE